MPKYIDAELVKKELNRGNANIGLFNYLIAVIESTPAADVEEVRHGEWIQCTNFPRMHWCSECNREVFDETDALYVKFPYCHCGAKMGGKNGKD